MSVLGGLRRLSPLSVSLSAFIFVYACFVFVFPLLCSSLNFSIYLLCLPSSLLSFPLTSILSQPYTYLHFIPLSSFSLLVPYSHLLPYPPLLTPSPSSHLTLTFLSFPFSSPLTSLLPLSLNLSPLLTFFLPPPPYCVFPPQ